MKVATAEQMRRIDSIAINDYGIPGVVLMENAGLAVVNCLEKIMGCLMDKKISIFAGKGNNGGDGYVIARHLCNKGVKVKVFLLGEINNVAGDAKINLDIICQMGIDVIEVTSERDWDKAKIAVAFADCLVDALLGTGFKGELSSEMAQAIKIINNAEKPVFAVDIPSGVNANNGQISSLAVQADYTVTFGLFKPGLLLHSGALHAGRSVVADIGIPVPLLTDCNIKQNIITAALVRQVLVKRCPDAHKGTCGRVLVVAGSVGLTGAAALSSLAAMRAGAGLVTLGIADSLNNIMEVKLTEVMTKPLPEIAGGAIGIEALPVIEQLIEQCDVLAIGPGLGRQEETGITVGEIVKTAKRPMVIDADALYALAGATDILSSAEALAVLTPHPGEMARLMDLSIEKINEDRVEIARRAAVEWESVVVLKGAPTVVAFPDSEVYINTTGNAGMATGGTGDVLTGVIAAFIAQGMSSQDAAVAGVYIHGLAGNIAIKDGMVGMMAGDLLPAIQKAINDTQEGQTVNCNNVL